MQRLEGRAAISEKDPDHTAVIRVVTGSWMEKFSGCLHIREPNDWRAGRFGGMSMPRFRLLVLRDGVQIVLRAQRRCQCSGGRTFDVPNLFFPGHARPAFRGACDSITEAGSGTQPGCKSIRFARLQYKCCMGMRDAVER
jgi:hypothetical protein